ncbi:thioredoxin family protein [Terriglobus albidus]|uniref:thioredoxin family protein n=1 Tax=Terriglobus albidus TaxID=1592106 RepID=UPI0021E0E2E3|nr:thioredoxin family protein [Terriglobus albidus]
MIASNGFLSGSDCLLHSGGSATAAIKPVLAGVDRRDRSNNPGKGNRRYMGAVVLVALFLFSIFTRAAFAGDIKPYNTADFNKLAAEGKPILLDIRADWCTTCAAQAPVIRDLMAQSKYKDLTTFTINFDTDAALLLAYHVEVQSTLIVLKGKHETGRSVGDTSRQGIERLLSVVIH